jgi:hypothetical protein
MAIGVAMLSATAALSSERTARTAPAQNWVLFSGGVPSIQIQARPGSKTCPYELREATSARYAKPVFAIY